ncbi:MAG: hypothetical protein ACJ8C4_08780 [Gemmataceae bacterium]
MTCTVNGQELTALTEICQHFRFATQPVPIFQQFIIARLEDIQPSLAKRIARFDSEQFVCLMQEVNSCLATENYLSF